MRIVTEEQSASLATHELAFEAAREALIAAVDPATASFPVVHGHGSYPADRSTVKSGAAPGMVGLKVGSYWPGNVDSGLPRHSSTIRLMRCPPPGGWLGDRRPPAGSASAIASMRMH